MPANRVGELPEPVRQPTVSTAPHFENRKRTYFLCAQGKKLAFPISHFSFAIELNSAKNRGIPT